MSDDDWRVFLAANAVCADCGAALKDVGTSWASRNLGVLLCIECAGCHRNLGVEFSSVASLSLDTWTDESRRTFVALGGNAKANARVQSQTPPMQDLSDRDLRNAWIRAKWTGVALDKTPRTRAQSIQQTTVNAGILKIDLKYGRNLAVADLTGKSDPYIVVSCGRYDKSHKLKLGLRGSVKSSVVKQTLNPNWDETLMLNVARLSDGITFWCWDWDMPPKPHDSLGFAFVDISDLQDGIATQFAPALSKKGYLSFTLTFTKL